MKHQHSSGLSQLFGLMAESARDVGETTRIEGHTRLCHIVADHAKERSAYVPEQLCNRANYRYVYGATPSILK